MNKNVLTAGLLCLVIGIAAGYWFGSERSVPEKGMHMMPNGMMMADSGSTMHDSMAGMMSGLSGKTGDDFDKAFLEEMIVHHEGAVDMAEALLKNTKRSELQKLGNDIITAQTGEIRMMREWLQSWF
jgi:uncharacterized protein (DUF305 family)